MSCNSRWRPPAAVIGDYTRIRWKVSWSHHKQEVTVQQSAHRKTANSLVLLFYWRREGAGRERGCSSETMKRETSCLRQEGAFVSVFLPSMLLLLAYRLTSWHHLARVSFARWWATFHFQSKCKADAPPSVSSTVSEDWLKPRPFNSAYSFGMNWFSRCFWRVFVVSVILLNHFRQMMLYKD